MLQDARMAEVTFRDFAGAVMQKDTVAAGRGLEELLDLDPEPAAAAARHFDAETARVGPAFMAKAMGLRTAVASGTDDDIRALLGECFGLGPEQASTALTELKRRYPR